MPFPKKIEEKLQRYVEDLCNIPSPSGFTKEAEKYLIKKLTGFGYKPVQTKKNSVVVDLGGKGKPICFAAHIDTLGAMVRAIKPNGRLRITKIGGYPENYIETENCIIHTRTGKEFTGTFQISNPSLHVNREAGTQKRDDTTLEVFIDEKVKKKEDVEKLGISPGDFISFDSRTRITKTGFIKSRHLDDKASAGILLALAESIKNEKLKLKRKVYLVFTVYEEVGHGGAAGIPLDIDEMISVDMGAVGDDLSTDEFKVSICAKDSNGPYDYDLTNTLIKIAKAKKLNYAVDIYPFYGSDVDVTLSAGYDIKHGLIGPGVFASHGYERTHTEALINTYLLIKYFIS